MFQSGAGGGPGVGGFVGGQDAQTLEPGSWSYSVLASLMKRPIVLTDLRSGEVVSAPIGRRLGYELAVARGISPRLQLGLALPMAFQDGERLRGIGLSEEFLAPAVLSDLRVHAKLRLQPDAAAALGYGVAMHLGLPTGNERHFAGERGAVLGWMLVAGYRGQSFRVAGNLGLRLRTKEVVLLSPASPHGNELVGTLAGEYILPSWGRPLGLLAEMAQVYGDDSGPSPGELRAGLLAHLRSAQIKAILGIGTTPSQVGSPKWRLALVYHSRRF